MKYIFLIGALLMAVGTQARQTCTLSCGTTPCSVTWGAVTGGANCVEGGAAGDNNNFTLVIPVGVTLIIPNNFSWQSDQPANTPLRMMEVYGTLKVEKNFTVYASLTIESTGRLTIENGGKLFLGSNTNGCGAGFYIETGGIMDGLGSSSERLRICNDEILSGGNAGCDPLPVSPSPLDPDDYPYCLANTLSGPVGFTETGGFLPVELVYFKAKNLGDQNLCEWQTATEYNNSHFEVQRSIDGENFTAIGTVDGVGTNYELQNYRFPDYETRSGITYYRLKQVDFDGTFTYSKVASVLVDVDVAKPTLFPNPIEAEQFTVAIPQGHIQQVIVYSMLGQELKQESYQEAQSNVSIDLAGFAKGKYLVVVVTSAGIFRNSVMKL